MRISDWSSDVCSADLKAASLDLIHTKLCMPIHQLISRLGGIDTSGQQAVRLLLADHQLANLVRTAWIGTNRASTTDRERKAATRRSCTAGIGAHITIEIQTSAGTQ